MCFFAFLIKLFALLDRIFNPFHSNVSFWSPWKHHKNKGFTKSVSVIVVYGKICFFAFLIKLFALLDRIFNPFHSNVSFWSPWKHHKNKGFMMISRGSKGNIGKKRVQKNRRLQIVKGRIQDPIKYLWLKKSNWRIKAVNHLSANSANWSNTLKQFVKQFAVAGELLECVWPFCVAGT